MGNNVPILLSKRVFEGLDVLNVCRKSVGVPEENPYVFASITSKLLKPIRGNDAMSKNVAACNKRYEFNETCIDT